MDFLCIVLSLKIPDETTASNISVTMNGVEKNRWSERYCKGRGGEGGGLLYDVANIFYGRRG